MDHKKLMIKKHFVSSNLELRIENDENDTVYRENEKQIISLNENQPFTEVDFKERIKHEVLKFVNQSFYNVIVLAGAGASVVTNDNGIDKEYGKTIKMLLEKIHEKLETDNQFLTLKELSALSKYSIPVLSENKELNEKFNLEDFLSNLLTCEKFLSVGKDKKKKFKKSKEAILEIIKAETSYSLNLAKMKHGKLLNVLSSKVKAPNKLTVITTNYDTLFEEAAKEFKFTIMDGFSFSSSPFFDIDMFEWNLVKDVPNVITKELEYKSNVINLLKIHGSLTWERDEDNKSILRKEKLKVTNPIMIFPSAHKYAQSYEEPYFELFTKFQELLKRPNTLLITTGFSFADTHISKMITGAIKNNTGLSVLISDFDIEQNHENWKELESLQENHFRIAFLKATLNDDLTDYLGGQNDNR